MTSPDDRIFTMSSYPGFPSLTKRELFALALYAVCPNTFIAIEDNANKAVERADALIKALNQGNYE